MTTKSTPVAGTENFVTPATEDGGRRSSAADTEGKEGEGEEYNNNAIPIIQLRILCLHDAHSNASEFKESLDGLGRRLYEKHGIDLVYVNSPLALPSSSSSWDDDVTSENEYKDNNGSLHQPEPPKRVWWEEIPSRDTATSTTTPSKEEGSGTKPAGGSAGSAAVQYRGMDASLLLLRQIWTSAPFWGILGVGRQGAAIASLLTLMLPAMNNNNNNMMSEQQEEHQSSFQQPQIPPPSVCIFVSGEAILPEEERLMDTVACLHLVDDDETDNNSRGRAASGSERLIKQFGGRVQVRQPTTQSRCRCPSHFTKSDWNAIGRFLIEQKNKQFFCRDDGSGSGADGGTSSNRRRQIVALQAALHMAEVDASNVIAEEIAQNPPAALMAVIRPQGGVSAGWSGKKRLSPGEKGGGAPCPSEFLLKREKRPTRVDNGASREHPKNDHQRQQQNSDIENNQQQRGETTEEQERKV